MSDARSCWLAVTLGDPRGIGPEVAAAAARALADRPRRPGLFFIGPEGTGVEGVADRFLAIGEWHGEGVAAAGHLAGRAIEVAVQQALAGEVAGVVTAPIDKAALHQGGYTFPGHTEMLADLAAVPEVAMVMCAERTFLGAPLRVLLATTHLPLRAVPAQLTSARLVSQTRLLAEGLARNWGISRPHIALCAFNPHASDGGLFGDEEERVYGPAVQQLRGAGLDVTGPIPADTVFLRAGRGEFDAVVAPYHDVGMAAFKTAAFGKGVNVTLGLPFARTSPDHGTALDIAGQGKADPSSMVEAILLAERFAGGGQPRVLA